VDTKGESVWRRWFGKRREVESDPPARDPAARETLGRLLRVFVDLDIDLAEPEAKRRLGQLTRWAAEVVAALGPRDPDEPPVPEPDWVSLRKTFTRHRRAERHFVAETIGGFREALVNVAQSLTRTVESDGAGDARVARSIAGLKALARTPTIDLQRLRSSVMETVGVVEAAANERAERHQQEVGRLRDILRAMRVELKRANEKAETDPLTGLANRASLDGHLAGTAAIGAFRNSPTTLILMDLDHFKRVNDDHGHLAGDAVLRTVGERLRALGLRETDLIARYGAKSSPSSSTSVAKTTGSRSPSVSGPPSTPSTSSTRAPASTSPRPSASRSASSTRRRRRGSSAPTRRSTAPSPMAAIRSASPPDGPR